MYSWFGAFFLGLFLGNQPCSLNALKTRVDFSLFSLPMCETTLVHLYSPVLSFLFLLTVSDLQEEGKNAINLPMCPAPVEVHPEDSLLGTAASSSFLSWAS